MTGMLASVTSESEARLCLVAGVDVIDLKNPLAGALGALPLEVITGIVNCIGGACPVSATVGDLPMEPDGMRRAVEATAATGVDFVKIGFFGQENWADCCHAVRPVAEQGVRLVAVTFADQRPDFDQVPMFADCGFAGIMVDTAGKRGGSLTAHLGVSVLERFVRQARRNGLFVGLAGSLTADDIPTLAALEPDFLGFRGALCRGHAREAQVDPVRLQQILLAVRHHCATPVSLVA